MYDDTHQSRESRTTDDAQKSGEFNGECKNPHAPHYAVSTCRPDGAARRVMDDLLRECLRRKSLTEFRQPSCIRLDHAAIIAVPGVLTPILFIVLKPRRVQWSCHASVG